MPQLPSARRVARIVFGLVSFLALTASAAYTIGDGVVTADTTAGAVVYTLPAASGVPAGTEVRVVKVAGGNDCTAARTGADTINGVAGDFSFAANGVNAATFVSNGSNGWVCTSAASFVAGGSQLAKIVTVNAVILAGTATVNTANLGLGSLVNKRIVVSLQQAAEDATATRFRAIGNGDGTVTVSSEANATAGTTVAIFVDGR